MMFVVVFIISAERKKVAFNPVSKSGVGSWISDAKTSQGPPHPPIPSHPVDAMTSNAEPFYQYNMARLSHSSSFLNRSTSAHISMSHMHIISQM